MTPEISNYIDQRFQALNSASRFQLSPTSTHTHDGVNSPNIFQPTITYVGMIGVGSAVNPVTVNLLPSGWTVRYDGTGEYAIIHNLGTYLYVATASCTQSTNIYGVPVISGFTDEVEFVWADIATGLKADTGFFFQLTVINNKNTTLPTYYGNLTHPFL